MSTTEMNPELSVKSRYSLAASEREPELCCAVDYDPRYLSVIPEEILERDYGCGDPSKYLRQGETVLDLGSGGGKICYIASQVVGSEGRVIGVDMNDDMLALAEKHRSPIGDALGYHNVEFHKGKIQDLDLDYGRLEARLEAHPVGTPDDLDAIEQWKARERREHPMVSTASVDVVVSNCVLNLVDPRAKSVLFQEMHRVLKRGGRVAISDIVSDEDVPEHLRADPELWSGCISGAFREDLFLKAFEEAGFYGIEILARDEKPWQTHESRLLPEREHHGERHVHGEERDQKRLRRREELGTVVPHCPAAREDKGEDEPSEVQATPRLELGDGKDADVQNDVVREQRDVASLPCRGEHRSEEASDRAQHGQCARVLENGEEGGEHHERHQEEKRGRGGNQVV